MPKLQPTTYCCGCFSLLFGVQSVCAINLVIQILIVSFIDSRYAIKFNDGVEISPETQVLWGTWFLLGIPVVISAGVGAVYRVEPQLRFYYYYLFVTFCILLFMLILMIFQGQICASMVDSDVLRSGGALVCGMTDAVVVALMVILGIVYLYLMFIVWSAAEMIQMSFFPELIEYKQREQAEREQQLQQSALASTAGLLGPPIATASSSSGLVPGGGATSREMEKRKAADANFIQKTEMLNDLHEKTDATEVARIIDKSQHLASI